MINKREEIIDVRKKLKGSLGSYHFNKVHDSEQYEGKTKAMKLVNVMRRYMKKFPDSMTPTEKVRHSFDILCNKYTKHRKNNSG